MGTKDEALFEKAYEEINPPPLKVEGRGDFLLMVDNVGIGQAVFEEAYGKRAVQFRQRYYFWFASDAELGLFEIEVRKLAKAMKLEFLYRREKGPYFASRPKVFATVEYKGKQYKVEDDFDYGYPVDTVIYYWNEGNFSCDCNRRLWIEKFHPGTVPEAEDSCGDTIEVVEFSIELIA